MMMVVMPVISPSVWPWVIGPHRIEVDFIQIGGIGHAFQILFGHDTDFPDYRAFLVANCIVCHDIGFTRRDRLDDAGPGYFGNRVIQAAGTKRIGDISGNLHTDDALAAQCQITRIYDEAALFQQFFRTAINHARLVPVYPPDRRLVFGDQILTGQFLCIRVVCPDMTEILIRQFFIDAQVVWFFLVIQSGQSRIQTVDQSRRLVIGFAAGKIEFFYEFRAPSCQWIDGLTGIDTASAVPFSVTADAVAGAAGTVAAGDARATPLHPASRDNQSAVR